MGAAFRQRHGMNSESDPRAGGNDGSDDFRIRTALLGMVLQGKTNSLRPLILGVADSEKLPPHMVARALYKLSTEGAITLNTPAPPAGAAGFFSRWNLKYLLLLLVPFLTGIMIAESSVSLAVEYARIVLGLFVVLVLPGYGLVKLLYPSKELSLLHVWVYSGALSLALIPLIGLALNHTRWGITADSTFGSFVVVDLVFLLAASLRSLSSRRPSRIGQ